MPDAAARPVYQAAGGQVGGVFTGRPLVRRNSYWSTGLGVSWMIHRSSTPVEVPD